MTTPRFLAGARADFLDAMEHYSRISASLAADFRKELMRNLDLIIEFPQASPIARGEVRRKQMRRFPFSVLYFIEDESPVITAVMHNRRRPGYWHRRIRKQGKA